MLSMSPARPVFSDEEGSDRAPLSTASLLTMLEQTDRENAMVAQEPDGTRIFQKACTQCHDAERATNAKKTYDGWLMTVRRMAEKSGSDIPESQIEPIAAYLASLNGDTVKSESWQKSISASLKKAQHPSLTLNAEISLIWRDGDAIQQNKGFFPDVWFGAEWRPKNSPFNASITACTSCHETSGDGLSLELAEASFTADLVHLIAGLEPSDRTLDVKANVTAGRFIVPFGAFSGMAHPGSYRTVTTPLMFNMGRRTGPEEFLAPVLPMPYSDEGIDLYLGAPLPAEVQAGLDFYAVNGLQSDFFSSRSYSDNNSDTALGGRATVGNGWVRFGASYGSGEMHFEGQSDQSYSLIGGDVTARYLDWIRAYYEYARREEETLPSMESEVKGHVGEVEGKIWNKPRIALLVRYDTLKRAGLLGDDSTERITWGPIVTLRGGSLLILNHEHWMFDTAEGDEDTVGFRWVAVF